ncbi:MAG: hypothetical protein QM647_02300 [Asticcacaulis sp.]|uniref:hypothetical protein n=1 Tax=Asticcacaulis sp. TaxID=1872648 RepID=UPI0039E26BB6
MRNNDLDKLFALAGEAKREATWQGFADYLEQHGKGIRKKALVTLNRFIDDAVLWTFTERLRFSLWLLNALNNDALVQPLKERLVIPTLREWKDREPLQAEPYLWLGLLGIDQMFHIRRALELDPKCQRARAKLCEWVTGHISYNQHELPSFYIHDPRVDLLDLAEAEALCVGYEETDWAIWTLAEIKEQRELAEAWLRNHPRLGDFASH